jgi:hypothetical protein
MSKQAIRARRLPLSALLASVVTGAAVLLLTSGIASGSSSSAQYEYGHPVPTSEPTVSGTAQVGQTLTTTNGGWTSDSNVSRYAYAWARCDTNGANCVTIGGATANTYKLVDADQGHRIRSYVNAYNSNGNTQQESNATAVVAAGTSGGTTTPTGKQIAAASVQLPNRLIVDQVKYSANPIRSRKSPTVMQVHVSDSHGNSVAGAKVFVEGLPYSRVANMPETTTTTAGWATVNLVPAKFFPRTGYLVLFVRARVEGQDTLGGTSTRRLVQVTIGAPNGS